MHKRGERNWLRNAGLGIFVLIGAVLVRAKPENGSYYEDRGELAQGLAIGAVVTLILLAVVGSIAYAIARGRGRRNPWREVTFGRASLLITFVILFATGAGQAAQREQHRHEPGSSANAPRGGRASAEWDEATSKVGYPLQDAIRAHLEFVGSLGPKWKQHRSALLRRARETQGMFKDVLAQVEDLPANQPREREVNEATKRGLELIISGYDDYALALKRRDQHLMDSGDRKYFAGQDKFIAARNKTRLLLGTPATKIGSELSALSSALTKLKPTAEKAQRLDARFIDQFVNENIPVERARATGVQARTTLRGLVRQYRAIRTPTDRGLARYLADTTRAWSLISRAYDDFLTAIDQGNNTKALLVAGDAKRTRGYTLLNAAAQRLAVLVRQDSG
jgi:hypothetical protein